MAVELKSVVDIMVWTHTDANPYNKLRGYLCRLGIDDQDNPTREYLRAHGRGRGCYSATAKAFEVYEIRTAKYHEVVNYQDKLVNVLRADTAWIGIGEDGASIWQFLNKVYALYYLRAKPSGTPMGCIDGPLRVNATFKSRWIRGRVA